MTLLQEKWEKILLDEERQIALIFCNFLKKKTVREIEGYLKGYRHEYPVINDLYLLFMKHSSVETIIRAKAAYNGCKVIFLKPVPKKLVKDPYINKYTLEKASLIVFNEMGMAVGRRRRKEKSIFIDKLYHMKFSDYIYCSKRGWIDDIDRSKVKFNVHKYIGRA